MVIIATGNETEFGQIAELSSRPNTESPVQQKIDKLVGQIVAVVIGMSIVAFTLAILRGMPLADSLSFVMALAVSAVPEGLPVAISVILVLGMRRMAVRHALVRNMRAIETIGALTTIATDKTGTLTKNKLEIQTFWHPDDVTETKFSKNLINAVMNNGTMHDPLDVSIAEYASREKILASAIARIF
ncbi:hypothetical protein B7Z28_01875 [Candidatus Saccharibacteria bacterium 32-45-3]|nr:MAG: hypothetical protein B7Z28_01875 [Candidatus Saccharibacteria bacterium 32-45-3]